MCLCQNSKILIACVRVGRGGRRRFAGAANMGVGGCSAAMQARQQSRADPGPIVSLFINNSRLGSSQRLRRLGFDGFLSSSIRGRLL